MDDCRAARVAAAFRRRFGPAAPDRAAVRLARAVAGGDLAKGDLFVAVGVILRDTDRVYSRSRV